MKVAKGVLVPCGRPSDNDAVGSKEIGRLGRFCNVNVSRNGMRAVFLLDVGHNEHMFSPNGLPTRRDL